MARLATVWIELSKVDKGRLAERRLTQHDGDEAAEQRPHRKPVRATVSEHGHDESTPSGLSLVVFSTKGTA